MQSVTKHNIDGWWRGCRRLTKNVMKSDDHRIQIGIHITNVNEQGSIPSYRIVDNLLVIPDWLHLVPYWQKNTVQSCRV